jgi:hypothetical protein
VLLVLADNQKPSAQALQNSNAVWLMGAACDVAQQLPLAIRQLMSPQHLSGMSLAASQVTDGLGCDKTLHAMKLLCV